MAARADDTAQMQLPPRLRGVVAFALSLGTFMPVLDTTIANVSLPTIAGNLGVSPNQGTWIITSYALANGISVPLTGWLMQRFGVVRTFTVSVLLFTLASFLCGIAWSFPVLLVFRVLQGALAGPMIPGSQALLLAIFPASKRGMALAIWSMTTLVAPVLGPLLGGYISDSWSWPWIFLINVPIGLLSAALCWGALRSHETVRRRVPVDVVGLAMLVVWVGALQLMLDNGKDADWFASPFIVVLALIAAVGFCAFLIWELNEPHPIVDLRFFRMRNFTIGVVLACLGYAVFFGNLVILPLWLQTQIGYTATWAGLVQAPNGLVALLLSPFAGRLVHRYDARGFTVFSLLVLAASLYMRSLLNTQATYLDVVLPMAVQGVSVAFFFVATITITLDRIPPAGIPAAAGLSNFVRITASAFATSIATTMWDSREALHQSRLAEATSAFDPRLQQVTQAAGPLGADTSQTVDLLTRGLIQQSYTLSSLDLFWSSAVLLLPLIALVWFARRPQTVGELPAGD